MGTLLVIILAILIFIGVIAYFISRRVYRRLSQKGYKSPKTVSAIIFVLSFVSILAIVCVVFVYNFRFER